MSQPANTFDSYDSVGIREDLSSVIHNISPEETPFYSKSAKKSASNTFVEWQTDSLRASAANAHIEGDATAGEARAATTRLATTPKFSKTQLSCQTQTKVWTRLVAQKKWHIRHLKLRKSKSST